MTDTACTCGCGTLSTEPCGCGCGCCAPIELSRKEAEEKSPKEEITELRHLAEAAQGRLAELQAD